MCAAGALVALLQKRRDITAAAGADDGGSMPLLQIESIAEVRSTASESISLDNGISARLKFATPRQRPAASWITTESTVCCTRCC